MTYCVVRGDRMRQFCIVDNSIAVDLDEKLCNNHKMALKQIKEGYDSWTKAKESLTFKDYLLALLNPEVPTGVWITEVVEAIINEVLDEDIWVELEQ